MDPIPDSCWELVERAAQQRPDEVVLADDHGRSLTASALAVAAEGVAAALQRLGVRPGGSVSWQLPTTLEAAVLMAACARLGVVQNPIIPVFRREVGFITSQVGSDLVVVPERWLGFEHAAEVRALGRQVLALDLAGPPDAALRLPSAPADDLPPAVPAPGQCRWIYFSSGTTAEPKGARHADSSVMASSNGVVDGLGMRTGEVYPIAWPISHIGGIAMLTAVLRAGGTLVLFDSFDPATVGERMARHGPTILGSATPFFLAYLDAHRRAGDRPLFPRLRTCVSGGAATPATVNEEIRRTFGVSGVAGSWGLTEFPVATSEHPEDSEVGTTVGRPTSGVQVRVVDGELRLKGPPCFLGYLDPVLDGAAFDEDGWFRTGDLGSIDGDGRVRIEGRLKDVIVRNAENVSALEVEEVLARHPSVAEVAVVGVPDERTGERVCAVVVPVPGARVGLEGLVEHCRAAGLARFKRPEQLRLVDQLPRNPMGKVLKREL